MSGIPGTVAIQDAHRFDEAVLQRYLNRTLTGFDGPMEIRQFHGGQSNPTYYINVRNNQYVLRKKPPGKLAPSAHAIDREYRVMKALERTEIPVPHIHHFCADEAIIGTPFYLMDYVPGRIFTDPQLPNIPAEERYAIYDDMNNVLAKLHSFDWLSVGLGNFGKHEDYFARQIAIWSKQYLAVRPDTFAPMERLMQWLSEHLPAGNEVSITHGDFRIGNLIYHPEKPRVVAVLDWELSTLGHPLSDLAFNCMTYHLPAGHPVAQGLVGTDLALANIPGEDEYIKTYCQRTGRNGIEDWNFYMAFSLFRTAAIMHGVYARSIRGNASSSNAHLFGDTFRLVAEKACELITENTKAGVS